MTARDQSGHTRRVLQRLDEVNANQFVLTSDNHTEFVGVTNNSFNNAFNQIANLQTNVASLSNFDYNQSNPNDPTSWESRIVVLEGMTGGYDPSDPNQPVIVHDNFLTAVDGFAGDYPVPFQNDSDGLRLVSPTFIRNGNMTMYEGPSEADHVGVYRVMATHDGSNDTGTLTISQPITGTNNVSVLWESVDRIYFVIKSPNDAAAPGFTPYPTSTSYDMYLGLFEDGPAPPTNGIYFKRLAGGNWLLENNGSGGVTNGVTTNTYASDTWYTLKIRRISTTEVGYTINGGTEEVVTGNVTLTGMTCGIIIKNNTSTTRVRSLRLDFFSIKFI